MADQAGANVKMLYNACKYGMLLFDDSGMTSVEHSYTPGV